MPTLKSCFGCWTVRTGTLVLGWFGVVIFGVSSAVCTYLTLNKEAFAEFLASDPDHQEEFGEQDFLYFALFIGIFNIVLYTCLVVGVMKEWPRLFLLWLIATVLEIVSEFIGTIYEICTSSFEASVQEALGSLVLNVFFIYFWLVVWSHYSDLREIIKERKRQHREGLVHVGGGGQGQQYQTLVENEEAIV